MTPVIEILQINVASRWIKLEDKSSAWEITVLLSASLFSYTNITSQLNVSVS